MCGEMMELRYVIGDTLSWHLIVSLEMKPLCDCKQVSVWSASKAPFATHRRACPLASQETGGLWGGCKSFNLSQTAAQKLASSWCRLPQRNLYLLQVCRYLLAVGLKLIQLSNCSHPPLVCIYNWQSHLRCQNVTSDNQLIKPTTNCACVVQTKQRIQRHKKHTSTDNKGLLTINNTPQTGVEPRQWAIRRQCLWRGSYKPTTTLF